MPSLKFIDLLLVSLQERRSKKIEFHPETTVVKGDNDTGKSSLLKSIYRCFGAIPPKVHPEWKKAHVHAALTFTVDQDRFILLQTDDKYCIFDDRRRLQSKFTSVTKGLGKHIAKLLGFDLKLPSRDNELVTPPPAYFFLPFYIDQDEGWSKNWSSFGRLSQFSDWKRDLAEYHTGIKPNKYYQAKGDYETTQQSLKPLQDKKLMFSSVMLNLEQKLNVAKFDVSLADYQKEIEELLVSCATLKQKEEEYKTKLVSLHNVKTILEAQVRIAKAALHEIQEDYKYSAEEIVEDHVDCPTCGAHYENSFAERFSIAKDEDRCYELLSELEDALETAESDIGTTNREFNEVGINSAKIVELLATKQGEVKLKDLIESEGRKEIQQIVRKDIKDVEEQISVLDETIRKCKAQMEKYEDRQRRKEITTSFRQSMRSNLFTLEVHGVDTKSLHVHSRITETGSDLPRATLAYYFSILEMMQNFTDTTICPLVIDSPNQQDQDPKNLPTILKFIRDKRPTDTQLVLGLVDDCNVDFGGKIEVLKSKRRLLLDDDYNEHAMEVRDLIRKSL